MGYTTEFTGNVTIEPPLNPSEVSYLKDLATTRRMRRGQGPYFVRGGGEFGQAHEDDVEDYNNPDPSQPGLWCQWVPSDDGTSIEWDGGEKFYYADSWMSYIVRLLSETPDAATRAAMTTADLRFTEFTFDHKVNGTIEAQGEDSDDMWRLVVEDNAVGTRRATIVWE